MVTSRLDCPTSLVARLVVVPALLAVAACGPDPSHAPSASDAAGRHDAHGIAQRQVPPGAFRMGTSTEQAAALSPPGWAAGELASEQPQHTVRLSKGFWIDTFEVSNAAFQAFVDAGGYRDDALWSADGLKWLGTVHRDELPVDCVPDAPPNHPRVCVTWHEAEAYARWRGGRLPTEAEWELAARGPDARVYPWGDDWDPAKANVVDGTGLTPIGTFPAGASWVGAHDMAGNAMEWVADWLDAGYYAQIVEAANGGEIVDPTGAATGAIKIEKGGWWDGDPFVARAAYRHFEDGRSYQDHHIGFRVVSDTDTEADAE
ncbi:MAG: formylglycine-generating enzyme family protein [Ardenticatenales bacterium]|nr:formylglycine-generating enzyme family protein [Ardenticatenales bacterium]